MLTLLRQLPYLQNRKYVLSTFRCTYSKRLPGLLANLNFEDPYNSDSKKRSYGEKEICLLQEIDHRAPLPGNTGGVPLRLSYTFKIKKVPRSIRTRVEASLPLPEENYGLIINQNLFNAVEKAVSISNTMECVAHKCPLLLRRDFLHLFPSRCVDETLTLMTLCLKTENDMSTWSEESEEEREKLSHQFILAAQAMTKYLNHMGFWADFLQPTTGKPHSTPLVDDSMVETDLRYRNFGLEIEDLGCCRIISHPVWGTNVFVGAIFTNAPHESSAINRIKEKTFEYPVFTTVRHKAKF